jgi:hypothetical protein
VIIPGPGVARPDEHGSCAIIARGTGVLSWRPLRGAAWSGAGVCVSRRISSLTVVVNWGLIYNRYIFAERRMKLILITSLSWFQCFIITGISFCLFFIWYQWNIFPLLERIYTKFNISVSHSQYAGWGGGGMVSFSVRIEFSLQKFHNGCTFQPPMLYCWDFFPWDKTTGARIWPLTVISWKMCGILVLFS